MVVVVGGGGERAGVRGAGGGGVGTSKFQVSISVFVVPSVPCLVYPDNCDLISSFSFPSLTLS